MDGQTDKDRQTDGLTLFYRALPAEAGVPKITVTFFVTVLFNYFHEKNINQ